MEQQRRPELRDKPVAVCGSQEERHGIVLTASYPAKRRGVKTGMAIWQAKQCCPELGVLPPDMSEYMRISRLARNIYERYTDQVEPFGLDEAWLDITGSVGIFGPPMKIAQEISDRVKYELMDVTYSQQKNGDVLFTVYTQNAVYKYKHGHSEASEEPNPLGMLPIVEYPAADYLGIFEPVVPLVDALNALQSNRMDDVAQYINSFLAILGAQVDEETYKKLNE